MWQEFISPNSFMGQAVWALLALSFLTAPMGCFMVWRKMSYFGATLAHSALLGAILGLITGVGILFGVVGFTMLLAVVLSFWLQNRRLPSDTLLGMIAHLTLALGIIAVSLMDELRMDLLTYLVGDVLAISQKTFDAMLCFVLFGGLAIAVFWRGFANLCICPDIAKVEGYPTQQLELIFTLVLSLTIALGMLSIGVLLIVAMLIIPAAAARLLSRHLKQMLLITWIISVVSIILGMLSAFTLDFPAGPSIVVMQGIIFLLTYLRLLAK